MKLSKALKDALLSTLLENTALTRDLVAAKLDVGKADAYGITPDEEDFWRYAYGEDRMPAIIALAVRAKRTSGKDAYANAKNHLYQLYNRQQALSLPYKSLSVLIASDAQVQAGQGLVADEPFIYLHSERGYYLDVSGGVGDYALINGDFRTLRVASDDEVKECVAKLTDAQARSVITHQYFGEVRQSLLTADDDEDIV